MKRLTASALALAITMSAGVTSFASTGVTDIEGNANEDAIKVVNSLGIVEGNPDGTFQPEKDVTRAEFATMITRALQIPESALASFNETDFKDTNGYGWAVPYLAYCESKGIMLGDGQGNVMPGNTITANEAVTMILRAVGYTDNSAALTGKWPANYITMAQDLGIYDDVVTAAGVDKAAAAQMIYNALTVGKVQVNADGTTEAIENAAGVALTMLTDGLKGVKEENYIVKGDEESIINLSEYVGQKGTVYMDEDTDEVLAFAPDSKLITGLYNSTTNELKTFDGETYKIPATLGYGDNLATAATKFVNGDEDSTMDPNGKYVSMYVDLSSKTVKEVYSVLAWDVSAAEKITSGELADISNSQSILGVDFALNDEDEIEENEFALVGVNSLDEIEEGNVVYVYENAAGEVARIEVGTETVTGMVKTFSAADEDFKVGDEELYNAANFTYGSIAGASAVTAGEVSEEITAYLDVNGMVYSFDNEDEKADTVAFVTAKGTNTIENEVKVVLADGTVDVLKVEDATDFAAINEDDMIRYNLNKDGEISSVEALTLEDAVNAKFENNSVVKTAAGAYTVEDDVTVFTYDKQAYTHADAEFDVTGIENVTKGKDTTHPVQLLFDADGSVIAVMVEESDCSGSEDEVFAVLNSKVSTANEDGDKVETLVGFANGEKFEALTDEEGLVNGLLAPDHSTAAATFMPQVYKLMLDGNGQVVDAEILTNVVAEDEHFMAGFAATGADGRRSVEGNGTIYALADDVVIYEVDDDNEYKLYSGDIKAGDAVMLFATDADDNSAYDIAVISRHGRI